MLKHSQNIKMCLICFVCGNFIAMCKYTVFSANDLLKISKMYFNLEVY